MALPILGFVFVIIATYFTYTNAKETGRNSILWSILTFVIGLGFQYIFPVIVLVFLTIYWLAIGYEDQLSIAKTLDDYSLAVYFGGIALSIVSMMVILRYVAQMKDDPYHTPPPSPPKFD